MSRDSRFLQVLKDSLRILIHHRWKCLCFILAIITVVGAYTTLSQRSYRSEARMLLHLGRGSVGSAFCAEHLAGVASSEHGSVVRSVLELQLNQRSVEPNLASGH